MGKLFLWEQWGEKIPWEQCGVRTEGKILAQVLMCFTWISCLSDNCGICQASAKILAYCKDALQRIVSCLLERWGKGGMCDQKVSCWKSPMNQQQTPDFQSLSSVLCTGKALWQIVFAWYYIETNFILMCTMWPFLFLFTSAILSL